MIGKQVKGKSFGNVLNYLLSKEDAILIHRNMISETPKSLKSEFKMSQSLKPNVKKCVYHASLSLPENEHLSDQQWSQIGERYLKEMGFGKSQFVIIRHTDTAHEHIHIVASRIGLDGKVVSDSYDYKRSEKVIRNLESDFGLTPVRSSRDTLRKAPKTRELRKAIEKHEPSVRMKLQEYVDFNLKSSLSASEFVNKLELLG